MPRGRPSKVPGLPPVHPHAPLVSSPLSRLAKSKILAKVANTLATITRDDRSVSSTEDESLPPAKKVKTEEVKTEEVKPEEVKPGEVKPEEVKPDIQQHKPKSGSQHWLCGACRKPSGADHRVCVMEHYDCEPDLWKKDLIWYDPPYVNPAFVPGSTRTCTRYSCVCETGPDKCKYYAPPSSSPPVVIRMSSMPSSPARDLMGLRMGTSNFGDQVNQGSLRMGTSNFESESSKPESLSPIRIPPSVQDPKCPGAPKKTGSPVIAERDRTDVDAYIMRPSKHMSIAAMFREWINHHGGLPSFTNRDLALKWCDWVANEVYVTYPRDPSVASGRAHLSLDESVVFNREVRDYSSGILYPWVYNWRAPIKSQRLGMKYNYIEDPIIDDYEARPNTQQEPYPTYDNLKDSYGRIQRKCVTEKCELCQYKLNRKPQPVG